MKTRMIIAALMLGGALTAAEAQDAVASKTMTPKELREAKRKAKHPLSELNGQKRLYVDFITDETTIDGYDQEMFVEMMTTRNGQEWKDKKWPRKYTQEWREDFLEDFAEQLSEDTRLVASMDKAKCEYQLVVNVVSSSEDGENIVAEVKIEHIATGRQLSSFIYNRKHADFGDMGEEIAKCIDREM